MNPEPRGRRSEANITGRRLCGAAVLAIAGILAGEAVLRGDEPTPEAVLDGTEIRELLAILESETFRDEHYETLRTEALEQLGRIVTEGGQELMEAAIRRVKERGGDDRRRAELVLAQYVELPNDLVLPLLDDDDIEVSTWAYLVLTSEKSVPAPPSRELDVFAQAADRESPPGRDPLLDVHANVRDAVDGWFEVIDGVAMTSRDHADDEVWRYDLSRRTLDLDGDGVPEHFVAAELSGGVEFLAMLRRPSADASWELAALARPENACDGRPVVADFDGDGAPDVGVSHSNHGIPNYGGFSVYSAKDRRFVEATWAYHDAVRVLFRKPGQAPTFASRRIYKSDRGCNAARCVGACAMRYELARWNGRTFEPVGDAFIRSDE